MGLTNLLYRLARLPADTKAVASGDPRRVERGHPTAAALGRLHAHSVHVYWTEQGNGVAPDPTWDTVDGDIVIDAQTNSYTVSGDGFTDNYSTD